MEIHWIWSDGVMNAVGIEAELGTARAESFHLLSWTAAMDLSLHLKIDLLCLAMPERRSLFLPFHSLSLCPSFYLSLFFFQSWSKKLLMGKGYARVFNESEKPASINQWRP